MLLVSQLLTNQGSEDVSQWKFHYLGEAKDRLNNL
jgi:hypothetical protein